MLLMLCWLHTRCISLLRRRHIRCDRLLHLLRCLQLDALVEGFLLGRRDGAWLSVGRHQLRLRLRIVAKANDEARAPCRFTAALLERRGLALVNLISKCRSLFRTSRSLLGRLRLFRLLRDTVLTEPLVNLVNLILGQVAQVGRALGVQPAAVRALLLTRVAPNHDVRDDSAPADAVGRRVEQDHWL